MSSLLPFKDIKNNLFGFGGMNGLEYYDVKIFAGSNAGKLKSFKNVEMKYTTIQLGNNKIELINSKLGNETIKVNGEIVSSKYSMLGTIHEFNITEDGRQVKCTVEFGFGAHGVVFDLYKDGVPIVKSEKTSSYWGFVAFMVIVAVIAIAFDLIS